MRFVAISDTHGFHGALTMPPADCLIVAGDLTGSGSLSALSHFCVWLKDQPHQHKVVIAGNHDWCLEDGNAYLAKKMIEESGAVYLENSGTEIDGIKIWGSPWTPRFFDWAFNADSPEDIRRHWDLIPESTDILVTHGPPHGILDFVVNRHDPMGKHCGCPELLAAVKRIQPKVHVFGHIHYSSGEMTDGGTKFINCAVVDERYGVAHKPKTFELPDPSHQLP